MGDSIIKYKKSSTNHFSKFNVHEEGKPYVFWPGLLSFYDHDLVPLWKFLAERKRVLG